MSTRSILGLIYMVQGLQQLGHDPEPILQRHGLSLAQLDPTTRIERSRELRIYADLSGSMQDPLIGLKLGGFYGLAGYGPLVMLLMTCATAYEALQVGVKYQRLTYLYGTLRLEPGEHMSALILDPMTMGHKAFRFRVDGEVAGTFKLVKDMQATMGLNLKPERVDMPYPKPPEAARSRGLRGPLWLPRPVWRARGPLLAAQRLLATQAAHGRRQRPGHVPHAVRSATQGARDQHRDAGRPGAGPPGHVQRALPFGRRSGPLF